MKTYHWHVEINRKRQAIVSEVGWRFENAGGYLMTDRGRLISSEDSRARCGVSHCLRSRFLSVDILEIRQTLRNTSSLPLRISEIAMLRGSVELEGDGWQLAHGELFKAERYFGGCSFYTGGLFAAARGFEGELGLSEDTPFPGLFFVHPERGAVLMAALSQERCKPQWRLNWRKGTLDLTARDFFSGISAIPVQPGKTFESERWVLIASREGMGGALRRYYELEFIWNRNLSMKFHFSLTQA
ncbi:MAG: hypothetical protein PHV34_24275 [Verrucomicrobiae bacterium]|nr:hypothetical protein [Verrucomicrobiae bacterium]